MPRNGVLAARLRVDMDELMILGDVGEGVDPRLIDQDPVGHPDLRPDPLLDFLDGGDRH